MSSEGFHKIDDVIKQKNVQPKECAYHTQRHIENEGFMRVLVLKADNIARVEYKCPVCKKIGYSESEWKRPFSTKCQHCAYKISVPKMKQQFKREMKKAP